MTIPKIRIYLAFLLLPTQLFAAPLSETIEKGLQNSRQYVLESHRLKAAENNKRMALSEFLPDISLSYQTGKKKDVRSTGNIANDFQTEKTRTLSLEQPIFNGFRSISGLKKGEAEYLAERYKFEYFKRDLISRMILSYVESYEYSEVLKLTDRNKRHYSTILDKIKSKAALTSENEIIDYKVGLYNAVNELEEVKNRLAESRYEYENIFGEVPYNLQRTDAKYADFKLEDFLTNASLNPLVQQKHFELIAAQHNYKREAGKFSPKVNLVASDSKQENLVYLDGADLDSQTIAINFKIPIFQKGQEYFGLKAAKYELEIKKEEYELTLRDIKKQMQQSFKKYLLAKRIYNQSYKITVLMDEKLKRKKSSFDIGGLSNVEILNMRIEKNRSKIKLHEARKDLLSAYYSLIFLTRDFKGAEI